MALKKKTAGTIILFVTLSVVSFPLSMEKDTSAEWGILKDIKLTEQEKSLTVNLIIDFFSRFRVFELIDPERIVIDLYGVWDIEAPKFIDVSGFNLTRIRHGMFQSEIARVVFEVAKFFPRYSIERAENGLKIFFFLEEEPRKTLEQQSDIEQVERLNVQEQIQPEKGEEAEEATEEIIKTGDLKKEEEEASEVLETEGAAAEEAPEKSQEKKEAADEIPAGRSEEETPDEPGKAGIEAIALQLEETQQKLQDTLAILTQLNDERMLRKKKFIRILATGSLFSPREGNLKNVFEKGMMYGAELNFGVSDFVELWMAEHYYSKTIVGPDNTGDEERSVSLIPIEMGLKFRMNKGVFNPYVGIGGGYFQYREETPEGEIREKNIGFIGQAGMFLKIGGFFIIDLFAHFKHCPITTESESFDIGGFHFGGAVGFEF